jgi:hypothetical protein
MEETHNTSNTFSEDLLVTYDTSWTYDGDELFVATGGNYTLVREEE